MFHYILLIEEDATVAYLLSYTLSLSPQSLLSRW